MHVLIAGGGVAGVEALLALRELAGDLVDVELLSPSDEFVYRPLQVVEPFGSGETIRLELGRIVADAGARHTRDALVSVDPRERTVGTASGHARPYEVLLVALGARAAEAVPGAITFGGEQSDRFSKLLAALGRRGTSRATFVVPRQATWSIAAYELALLTAAEREARSLSGVELALVTHESAPLELFGPAASELVATRLEQAGVELRTGCTAERFEARALEIADGEPHETDAVVALPKLEVQDLPGLPQRPNGFVDTDVRMSVNGLSGVWAAGDVTSFPVKQGGLATQQSDVAAGSIAAHAGAHVPAQTFSPVLRAALITGDAPDYLRARLSGAKDDVASPGVALWAPAEKIAGRYLAPYLAGELREAGTGPLADVELPADIAAQRSAHDRAVALLLAASDTDAAQGRVEDALRWLALVEDLNLVIPPAYVARRQEWRQRLDSDASVDEVAKRIDPRFGSASDAISDLQRRLGWLRRDERRAEDEMRAHLAAVDEGLEKLKALSRRTGVLGARE